MARSVLFALVLIKFISHSHAQVSHERKLYDQHFTPTESQCGLTRFSMATFDSEFIDFLGEPGRARHRMMAAAWETSDPSCLKEYGIVQYIRGCIYNITHDPQTGEIERYFGVGRDSRGKFTIFKHPVWEVDTVDVDPLYNSYEGDDASELNRFDWHKYPLIPLLLQPSNEALAKDEKILFHSINYDYVMNVPPLTLKQVFVTDLPSGSSYDPEGPFGKEYISLSSLEFRTCLYKTKDVPLMGDPTADPIICYDWSDKMKVDYKKKEFVRTDVLDPYCLK